MCRPAGRPAGIEARRLGDQDVGPVRMPSRGDEVFRLGRLRPGAAHVDRAGVGQSGRRPRHRAGEDEVDLAGRVAEAERLEGAAVAGRGACRPPVSAARVAPRPAAWRGPAAAPRAIRSGPRFRPPRRALQCPPSCACGDRRRSARRDRPADRCAPGSPASGRLRRRRGRAAAPRRARRRRSAAREPGPPGTSRPTAASPARGPGHRTAAAATGSRGIRSSWFSVRSATPSARCTSGRHQPAEGAAVAPESRNRAVQGTVRQRRPAAVERGAVGDARAPPAGSRRDSSNCRKNGEARAIGCTAEQTSWKWPGSMSSAVRSPPPGVGGRLVDVHLQSGAGQGHRRGEPVGA